MYRCLLAGVTTLLVLLVTAGPTVAQDPVRWHPPVNTLWQYQLQGTIDQTFPATFFVVDGFDTPAATVASLHANGQKAGCYVSAGSWEDWRPDAGLFPSSVLGAELDWPGERWLDIRRIDLLAPIVNARLDMCKAKGFDAVDPDNVDAYANSTGFELTAADQLAYNRFLAAAAHARGMAVGLKNDINQIPALVSSFDFAVNEECFQYAECNTLTPFVTAGKPVFNVEYKGAQSTVCAKAATARFMTMRKRPSLDAFATWKCWP